MTHPELAKEIAEMCWEDQSARFVKQKSITDIDAKHLPLLKEIIAKFGYPTREMIGEDGQCNLWLLVQHMDRDVVFQREVLSKMRAMLERKEILPKHVAYLEDRVRMHEGRPLLYGTQVNVAADGKSAELRSIEKPEELDARRAAYGLEPIADYLKKMEVLWDRHEVAKTSEDPCPCGSGENMKNCHGA